MERKDKVIIVDFSIFMFRAIFSWRQTKMLPTYTALNMIVSCLRKIGVEPTDKIIIARDYGTSWRKSVETDYKANRKDYREQFTDINWKQMFEDFNNLADQLNKSTHWTIVQEYSFEADDWMAVGCRYFKDKDVILVTYDKDVEQLCYYNWVKIFSPLKKYKGKKGGYKKVDDPLKVLASKIQKETSDNLTKEIVTPEDYEKRKEIVSLLKLPSHIEEKIIQTYATLKPKDKVDKNQLPFPNSLAPKIKNLYNDKKDIVDYDKCISYKLKKRKK